MTAGRTDLEPQLATWLHDSDPVAPDAVSSSRRVMASIDRVGQLGRHWPTRVSRRARPLPTATAWPRHDLPPQQSERPSTLTAARVVVGVAVIAAMGGVLLLGPLAGPEPVDQAMVAATMSPPPDEAEPTAVPTAPPTPASTDAPAPRASAVAATTESRFLSTRALVELEAGSRPIGLAKGPQRTAVYLDAAAGAAYMVARDGYRHTLAREGEQTSDRAVGTLASIARGGEQVLMQDSDGYLWVWADDYEDPPGWLVEGGWGDDRPPLVIEPSDAPLVAVTLDRNSYELYAVDPDDGSIVRWQQQRRDHWEPTSRISRQGAATALGLHVDPVVFVLSEEGVERYENGQRSASFELGMPPGDEPDYRFIDGIGSNGKGQLWLYDAAGARVVAFDKRDGRYLGSWAPGTDDPSMADLGGLYVEGDGRGSVGLVTWITPRGLYESAVTKAARRDAERRVAGTHAGVFKPATPDADARALRFADGNVTLEADELRLKVPGKTFRARGEVDVSSDVGDDYADLELEWFEGGIHQRIYLQLRAGDSHWWVDEIWTYDGEREGDWFFFEDLASLTRTPKGESLEGDLRIGNTNAQRKEHKADGTARLTLSGMRLTAFRPSDQPAPLTDCTYTDAEVDLERPRSDGSSSEHRSMGSSRGC